MPPASDGVIRSRLENTRVFGPADIHHLGAAIVESAPFRYILEGRDSPWYGIQCLPPGSSPYRWHGPHEPLGVGMERIGEDISYRCIFHYMAGIHDGNI